MSKCTHVPEKLVSIFEPTTEVIRNGKASKPTEFGKMVKIQEAENQIITCYSVYEKRPYDSALLIPAIESHVPRLVAGDAAFYSASNEKATHEKGVKRVCVPNRNTFPIATPRAPNGSGNKRNPGAATGRKGGAAAKGASAW